MKNKEFFIIFSIVTLVSIASIFSIGFAYALNDNDFQDIGFWNRIVYSISPSDYMFSIIGDARNCGDDKQPNYESEVTHNLDLSCSDADCEYCLIDVFRTDSSGHILSNVREYTESTSISSSSTYYMGQIYCCPEDECHSNSDCKLQSGGTCKTSTAKDPYISYESSSWSYCSYPTQTKATCYILDNNKCTQTTQWYAPCPSSTNGKPVYDTLAKCEQYIGGKCSTVTVDDKGTAIKNKGDCTGFENKMKCINNHLYDCTDFGNNLGYCWYGGYASSPNSGCGTCSVHTDQTSCTTVIGCTWSSGKCTGTESNTCSANQISCPDGTCQSKEEACCSHGADCNGGEMKTITLTEYYSTEDKKILKSVCLSDSQCPKKTKYDVSCMKDDKITERIYDANVDLCEDELNPVQGGILHFVPNVVLKVLVGKNTCQTAISIDNWVNSLFGSSTNTPGVCIAKGTAWYSSIWEQALTLVGGFGLPAQYVMIITIMLLLVIGSIFLKMLTGGR